MKYKIIKQNSFFVSICKNTQNNQTGKIFNLI